ncbi:MAG: hypothetical protein GYB66_07890 [Chloroflexi bacterium]|nr:hypothetical protein [Chloroflexota bacterium]
MAVHRCPFCRQVFTSVIAVVEHLEQRQCQEVWPNHGQDGGNGAEATIDTDVLRVKLPALPGLAAEDDSTGG